MNIKGLLGKGKDPPLQIEAATKTKAEPVVKADWKKKKEPAAKANATKLRWSPKTGQVVKVEFCS
jgi:hypothetical protein